MKCHGLDSISGEAIEVSFDQLITGADSWLSPLPGREYLSPGWIDLQVNGFAGVDYCSPSAPHEEIGRSIRAMFATGVTRFFPTVITGSPEDIERRVRMTFEKSSSYPVLRMWATRRRSRRASRPSRLLVSRCASYTPSR